MGLTHQEVDRPFRYSREFRRQACERMLAELGLAATFYRLIAITRPSGRLAADV